MIDSRQIYLEYSDIREGYKLTDDNAIEDMAGLKADVSALISLVNNGDFTPLEGVGSPEGVATSNSSKLYIDTTNSPTSVTMYYNSTINSATGWVQIV
jgi:hypothetical protein